jgi:hypothetical protein
MKSSRKGETKPKAAVKPFPPPYQFRWRAGPYRPPAVNVGKVLHDEYRGDVKVDGMTDAPIPWPGANYNKGRHDALLPILCGDLVRAVCEEDELTVAHYWGVTRHIVNQWKRALAGAEDSDNVRLNLALRRAEPAFRKQFGYQ